MTEFEQYFSALYDGTILACDKMKRVSEMLLNQFASPGEFHFDYEVAKWHIAFIERFCKQPTGKLGQPLQLELFQKARLQAIFGFVDDNNLRQYNEVMIVEGRKNGKTTECAAVETDLLLNDGEGAPEIYNVATMLDQSWGSMRATRWCGKVRPCGSISANVLRIYMPLPILGLLRRWQATQTVWTA